METINKIINKYYLLIEYSLPTSMFSGNTIILYYYRPLDIRFKLFV